MPSTRLPVNRKEPRTLGSPTYTLPCIVLRTNINYACGRGLLRWSTLRCRHSGRRLAMISAMVSSGRLVERAKRMHAFPYRAFCPPREAVPLFLLHAIAVGCHQVERAIVLCAAIANSKAAVVNVSGDVSGTSYVIAPVRRFFVALRQMRANQPAQFRQDAPLFGRHGAQIPGDRRWPCAFLLHGCLTHAHHMSKACCSRGCTPVTRASHFRNSMSSGERRMNI